MGELFGVIANEWTKLLRRKRLWVAGALMLLTVGLFGLTSYEAHKNILQNTPQMQLQQTQQMLTGLQSNKAQAQANQPEIQSLQQQIASLKTQIAAEKPGADWRKPLLQQRTILQKQMAQVPVRERVHSQVWHLEQGQLLQMNYQLAHNVKPPTGYQTSAYDQIMQYLTFTSMLFLPLTVVILVADMVAGEATDGTIKLLLVRPVSRSKILLGKWITSLIAAALATAVTCAALWAVGVAVFGGAGANQPQLVNVTYTSQSAALDPNSGGGAGTTTGQELIAHYGHAAIVSMGTYFFVSVLLTIFAMLVVATVGFLASTLFRSAMASTGVALGVVIIGFVLSQMAAHVKWIVDTFFPVHLALFSDWSGALSQQAQVPVSLSLGTTVLVVWGVVCLAVSLFYFSRRDVLNA
ncbi:ABC transporter permease [Alicyclobacillus sp. ALC3]|uniref:ABC transporter permease n=1 Tax=Alicyclobacillus sp. ALC3 TaxID=2796143 RepID=UPI002378F0E5|nr:ABC transporter permease [Alicyclobacillus sp. ALC3]WDL96250.1 ABC transporter permease subunit [Alicyclobacillus sp. ALC3]